ILSASHSEHIFLPSTTRFRSWAGAGVQGAFRQFGEERSEVGGGGGGAEGEGAYGGQARAAWAVDAPGVRQPGGEQAEHRGVQFVQDRGDQRLRRARLADGAGEDRGGLAGQGVGGERQRA